MGEAELTNQPAANAKMQGTSPAAVAKRRKKSEFEDGTLLNGSVTLPDALRLYKEQDAEMREIRNRDDVHRERSLG
jgi:hypothetical protein